MFIFLVFIVFGLYFLFSFDVSIIFGLYVGSMINIFVLVGLLDVISNVNLSSVDFKLMSECVVIGYFFFYFMGVIGVMIVINVMYWLLKIDYLVEEWEFK